MTDREWLGLTIGWAVSAVRGQQVDGEIAELESSIRSARDAGRPIAWDVLRTRLQLTLSEQKVLSMVLAVELSLELGTMIGRLHGDAQRTSVDVELLQRLIYSRDAESAARYVTELSPAGVLQRYRLVEVASGRETPFLLRQFRAGRRVVEWVHGSTTLDSEVAGLARLISNPTTHDRLRIAPALKQRATQLAFTLFKPHDGDVSPMLVHAGAEGAGRRTLALGIAASMNKAAIIIDCERLPFDQHGLTRAAQALLRETLLHNAIPILTRVDLLRADGNRPDRLRPVEDAFLQELPGLVIATAARGDARPAAIARGNVVVELEIPTEADRAELWQEQLGAAASDDVAAWAAARYTVTGGVIQRAVRSALAEAAARDNIVRKDDVHRGLRSTLDAKLAGTSRRLSIKQTWADVVLAEDVLEEVREIIARVKHRALVYDDWGLGAKVGKGMGISTLFSGPPGTGKTMIAGIIANELGLDLYQVDLSQVVSKYIGETEKNLSELFDAAEAGHAVLLFDEADSMFAKRTEVKSSNDRYANLEVNFLLQRMETFAGISILTTNLESSIDEAFKRRLSFRITFPLPEEEERERLWRTIVPTAAAQTGIDFSRLATRFEMSGGYIKNAVVRAAFMAADKGEPLSETHLLKAAALEYSAMGKVMHSSR